ncbi:unnamed protein product [Sympodiomycopsis kandeliae]
MTGSLREAQFEIPGQGIIRGTCIHSKDKDGSRVKSHRFTGIPYALPPLSSLRFRRPQPLPPSFQYDSNQRTYTTFRPICYNPGSLYDIPYGPSSPPDGPGTEDVLYLNMWIPSRPLPSGLDSWPIVFYIHGGWLQIGSAYQEELKDFSNLIDNKWDCIVIAPAYRLNVFGFCASEEFEDAKGNFGFWDQRAALEWTAQHAKYFGGNASNITIAGLSAGAQSNHAQLLHEYSRCQVDPSYKPLIRRCLLRSGSAVLPSKEISETKSQFQELCRLLDIPDSLASDKERIQALREISAEKLVGVIPRMQHHTFRSVKDGGPAKGGFVGDDWASAILNGDLSRWAKKNGITFVIGEAANEDQLYRLINAPTESTPGATSLWDATMIQLKNYYPQSVIDHLLKAYNRPADSEKDLEKWADYFGAITSDAQVFSAQRLLTQHLIRPDGVTSKDVLTYRLERRASLLDDLYPKFMGVFHGSDDVLFCYRPETILQASNKQEAERDLQVFGQFLDPLAHWIRGDSQDKVAAQWYGNDGEVDIEMKRRILKSDGEIILSSDPVLNDKKAAVQALQEALQASARKEA